MREFRITIKNCSFCSFWASAPLLARIDNYARACVSLHFWTVPRFLYFGISYYLSPAIANKRRINALSVRLVGFISSHQLTDRKPLVWPLSVVFRCLPTDRIYFCLDNRVLSVGITLLFAPSASISHSPDRRSYWQSWTRLRLGSSLKRVFVGFCDYPHK